MKIVTLNIWNGGKFFEAMRDFLVSEQADIYFLQEVYNGHGKQLENRFRTVELLHEALPEYFLNHAPAYFDTRKVEGNIDDGQLILSRWPLEKTENLPLDLPYAGYDQEAMTDFQNFPSSIQKAQITVDGTTITLLNVHGPVNLNGAENDHRRQKLIQLILNNVTEYTVVGGDFNMQPQTECLQLLSPVLQSVFGASLPTTFNLAAKDLTKFPGYATAAVDMLFTTPNFQIVNQKAWLEATVSDHIPLSITTVLVR
jgi:endonuclease/exonuclease/phosphatase family metal-dependent hydrolase